MLPPAQFSIPLLLLLSLASPLFAQSADNEQLESAIALTPDIEAGKITFALCAACHGNDGFGQQEGEFPSIAGQHQRVILKQMLDIQSKRRINPTMYPFMDMPTLGGLQGMADIAGYTTSLASNPEPVHGAGDNQEKGQALYSKACIACHGKNAQGNDALFYPRLTHQHYPYLVRELVWIRDKVRKNSDPAMVQLLQDFSNEDIQAVADYLSRL
jgi:cytochrome c553